MESNREQPEIITPVVVIEFDEEDLVLTWFNTTIKTYGNAQFNHVEVVDDDDETIGIIPKQSFMDLLFEKEFPYTFHPIVDPQTEEWFVKMSSDDLETLTPESFSDGQLD